MAALIAVATASAAAVVLLSSYIAWRALAGDEKFAFVRTIAIAFAATGGTSFRGADLTDANFTQATLKSTDFRGANVTRTCWFQTKKLDLARIGKNYLNNPHVRKLVITGDGQNKEFEGQDLRRLNLSKANLANASLLGSDFYQTNLQEANLSRTKLV